MTPSKRPESDGTFEVLKGRHDEAPNRPHAVTQRVARLRSNDAPGDEITEEVDPAATAFIEHLFADPSFTAAAKADPQLRIVVRSGDADLEAACMLAAMSIKPLQDGVRELGLGTLVGLCALDAEHTWYVRPADDGGLLVALGPVKRNPAETLHKFLDVRQEGG